MKRRLSALILVFALFVPMCTGAGAVWVRAINDREGCIEIKKGHDEWEWVKIFNDQGGVDWVLASSSDG